MENQSIRTILMKKLGITKEEATNMIKVYAQNHDGKVNPKQIERDIKKISNLMIFGVGNIYNNYDIKHELTECGKDRTYDAVMTLLDNDNQRELARTIPCKWICKYY